MKYKMIAQILIIFICIIMIIIILNIVMVIAFVIGLIGYELIIKKYELLVKKQAKKQKLKNNFYLYLKSVILLTYTRPLKNAFVDANQIKNQQLKNKIDKFIQAKNQDFSIKPYQDLSYQINDDDNAINYELNIMSLMYQFEQKGLGIKYINDVLAEIDQLLINDIEQKIAQIKDQSYFYTLPPMIINFFYLTFVLFKVINQIILSTIT